MLVVSLSWYLVPGANLGRSPPYIRIEKGVHQFRSLPPTMRTPNSIVVCSCMYAFLLKWDPMYTPPFTGVRTGSHLNRNAFLLEQTTICIHEAEVPKLVYNLFWCRPVQWHEVNKFNEDELHKPPVVAFTSYMYN